MRTKIMNRQANISEEAAMAGLKAAHPGSEILSFSTRTNAAGKKYYSAKVKLAEFPPAKGEDEDAPKDEPKDEGDEGDAPTDVLDLGGEDEDPLADEPSEPSIAEVMDLVKQIAEKVGVPNPDAEAIEDPLLGPDADALPDSGAPIAGEPAGDLPPPVPEKPMGMGSFASAHPELQRVAKRRHFVVERTHAGEISNRAMVIEAHEQFPGFRVAKLDRLVKADANIAVVALVARD